MTKTKTRILTALALTTALTAPVLIAPMFTAPSAVAAAPTTMSGVQDFSELAAKVTPAVVNVAVTMKGGAADDIDVQDVHRDRFGRTIIAAMVPAPTPSSTLTHATPGAHEESIDRSAASPPSDAP